MTSREVHWQLLVCAIYAGITHSCSDYTTTGCITESESVEWKDEDDHDLAGMTVSQASLVFPFVQWLTIFHRHGITTKNSANDWRNYTCRPRFTLMDMDFSWKLFCSVDLSPYNNCVNCVNWFHTCMYLPIYTPVALKCLWVCCTILISGSVWWVFQKLRSWFSS